MVGNRAVLTSSVPHRKYCGIQVVPEVDTNRPDGSLVVDASTDGGGKVVEVAGTRRWCGWGRVAAVLHSGLVQTSYTIEEVTGRVEYVAEVVEDHVRNHLLDAEAKPAEIDLQAAEQLFEVIRAYLK